MNRTGKLPSQAPYSVGVTSAGVEDGEETRKSKHAKTEYRPGPKDAANSAPPVESSVDPETEGFP